MFKQLFFFLLISVSFYYFYRIHLFIKGFEFGHDGEYVKNEHEEKSQPDNFLETSTEKSIVDEKEDINELNPFYDNPDLCQNNVKKYDELVKTIDNYIQRYISLFLITSNLLEKKVVDENEEITFDMEISIMGRDLTYLQSFSKSTKRLSHLKNFSKLDTIFSKIARAKEKSYMENAMWFSKSFLTHLNIFTLFNHPNFKPIFIFLTICFGVWTILHYFTQNIYLFLGVIINSAIIWEGLKRYWQKIKESDVEIYVKTLQLKNVQTECVPPKMGWYDKIVNFFYEDKCLQYYKTLSKNPEDEISLFNCIINSYSYYFIQLPVKLFGTSIRDLTGEISAMWPWPVRFIFSIPLVLIVTVMAGFFILILCGKRLRLSFFGAAVEIGDATLKRDKDRVAILPNEVSTSIASQNSSVGPEKHGFDRFQTPKSVRIIRKLKPWTKSRFPRRLDADSLRRRKLYLKPSESTTEVENTKEFQVDGFDGELCSKLMPKED